MATKKDLARMPRRIWRMTSGAPQGEYLELVPKEVQVKSPEARSRASHSGQSTAYGAVSVPARKDDATQPPTTASEDRQATRPQPAPSQSEPVTETSVRTRVLKPAQVESWQSSSFDLLTEATVSEVTDTIPGDLFDELFKPDH